MIDTETLGNLVSGLYTTHYSSMDSDQPDSGKGITRSICDRVSRSFELSSWLPSCASSLSGTSKLKKK